MLLLNIHVDPRVATVMAHATRPSHQAAIHHSTHSMWRIPGNVLLLPRNPQSPTDAGVVPLDNLCPTDIDSRAANAMRVSLNNFVGPIANCQVTPAVKLDGKVA